MTTRRRFIAVGVTGVAGLAAAVSSAWRTGGVDAAETFEVTHSDAEWRKLLTPDQYAVLRHEATERPFTSPLLHEERRGTFACAGCHLDAFSSTTKFESQHGVAELLGPFGEGGRHHEGHVLRYGTDGCSLPSLRRPPRSCLRRRSEADRASLLHERGRAHLQTRDDLTPARFHHGPVRARVSRRRPDHRQPLYPPGAALRVRSGGPAVRAQRTSAARGHGRDLRGSRHAGGGRRRVGGPRQPVRPRRRDCPAGVLWSRASVSRSWGIA